MDNKQALTVSVDRAAAILNIGRHACYEAVRKGEIPALRIGRRLRVPKAALAALLGVAPCEITSGGDA